jgi:aminoglycoside 6-adenylyltransferase
MRSEQEMMNLILNFARQDDSVRVVTMEGSRLNKNAPKDRFQDFDITFIVNDMEKYKKSDGWLDVFGKRIIMQKPEAMALFPPTLGTFFSFLMVFEDGNKLDLKLVPLNDTEKYFNWVDSLVKVLLDKDNICPAVDEPSDRDFHVKKPGREFVDDCCNEFWLLALYVAKGLCRKEFLFAASHLNKMREEMLRMISWKVGVETSFSLSVGKAYKYLQRYVSGDTWELIMKSYNNGTLAEMRESFEICCKLFRDTAVYVSGALNYKYPEYDKNVSEHMEVPPCRLPTLPI